MKLNSVQFASEIKTITHDEPELISQNHLDRWIPSSCFGDCLDCIHFYWCNLSPKTAAFN
jgi:hypothetical protein